MSLIMKVDSAIASMIQTETGSILSVSASGQVNTSGWSHPRLSPWFYIAEPSDGIWDFDFVADHPVGIVAMVVLPITAHGHFPAPEWLKGIRIHDEGGSVEALLERVEHRLAVQSTAIPRRLVGNVIIHQVLASYDDSFQPTGTIHWKNDGPFGIPNPHTEWKKLRHELALTVEGPDEAKIRECINQATAAGLIAAIAAAIATGGLGLPAAITAFTSTLTACLAGGTVRVEDQSHWIYWDA